MAETQHMNDSTMKHLNWGGESSDLRRLESSQKDSLLIPTMLEVEVMEGTTQSPRKKLKKVSSKRRHHNNAHPNKAFKIQSR